jgi:uncharacterized protein YdbL (DUF1318 family)
MKTAFTSFFILVFSIVYSQDSLKMKQIDALVAGINSSTLQIQRDTLRQDLPEIGLKMTTYLTAIVNDSGLIKYVNQVNSTRTEAAKTQEITSSSSFYFQHNKLIKVEEYLIEAGNKKTANWYYADDKPLHHSDQSGKAAGRATLLLTMSKEIMKQFMK